MDKDLENAVDWIKDHKLEVGAAVAVLLVIGFLFSSSISTVGNISNAPSRSFSEMGLQGVKAGVARDSVAPGYEAPPSYQAKTGDARVESRDALADSERLSSKAREFNGSIQSQNKQESEDSITVTVTASVPSNRFEELTAWLLKEFKVKDSSLGFYTQSVKEQQNEIKTLLDAIEAYDRLLARAEALPSESESADVIFRVTEKKLEVVKLLKQYGYSIEGVAEQSRNPVLTVSFTQFKNIKLFPENLDRELMQKIRNALGQIAKSITDLVTVPFSLLFQALTWIAYALVVLIPAYVAYKLLRKITEFIDKKI